MGYIRGRGEVNEKAHNFLGRFKEKLPHELVQIAVENCIDIALLDTRAVVLDQAIWLQNVRPDLAAPLDSLLGFLKLGLLLTLLLHLALIELCLQETHCSRPVLMLTAIVLTSDDGVRRSVSNAHGGIRLVDMLPARTARTICIDAQVLGLDLDLYILFDVWNYEDRTE